MEAPDLRPLIELLDDNIDDLEEALAPLLKTALSETAGKLPLLDKAQLYVLVTYAIESILFSYLRLNGTNAKEHPVFRELTRVKQYFEKIKLAESAGAKPTTQIDKAAAGRFIKHALAGNDKRDQALAYQKKADSAAHAKNQEVLRKRKHDSPAEAASDETSSSSSSDSEHAQPQTTLKSVKMNQDDVPQSPKREAKGEKERARKQRKR